MSQQMWPDCPHCPIGRMFGDKFSSKIAADTETYRCLACGAEWSEGNADE